MEKAFHFDRASNMIYPEIGKCIFSTHFSQSGSLYSYHFTTSQSSIPMAKSVQPVCWDQRSFCLMIFSSVSHSLVASHGGSKGERTNCQVYINQWDIGKYSFHWVDQSSLCRLFNGFFWWAIKGWAQTSHSSQCRSSISNWRSQVPTAKISPNQTANSNEYPLGSNWLSLHFCIRSPIFAIPPSTWRDLSKPFQPGLISDSWMQNVWGFWKSMRIGQPLSSHCTEAQSRHQEAKGDAYPRLMGSGYIWVLFTSASFKHTEDQAM
jgi:hypothetical protein